jgi:hypothetical protein
MSVVLFRAVSGLRRSTVSEHPFRVHCGTLAQATAVVCAAPMLIFVAEPSKQELEVYADEDGIEELKRALGFLPEGESHTHLFSSRPAGDWAELSSEPPRDGVVVFDEVILTRVESDGAPKSE